MVGINGATLATVICHIVAVTIDFIILKREINLKLKFSTFVLKPMLATIMMAICTLCIYNKLLYIFTEKISIILSLGFAVLIYIILVICIKIFNKENLYMIPFGNKMLKFLNPKS